MITYGLEVMRNPKVLINLVLSVVAILLLAAIFSSKGQSATSLIKGYISDSEVNGREMYESTFISRFDAEPEWLPGEENNTSTEPLIAGETGMLVEINSGDVLFEENSNERRPIASLVKIMTAVVALEHKNLDGKVFITLDAAHIGENSMGISSGETYSLEELMYGLVLNSGNDAAYAISESVAGNSDRFVDWMNFKAEELGLQNTYFADPSGLDDASYSTAADLVKLTRYALKNPEFRKIVATVEREIPSTDEHKYIYLYNQTNLLTTYPGVAGVKTGFTEEAGLSLVTYASNGGREVVGVVLNSIDRKGDMILMLDHSFNTLGVHVEHNLL